MSLTIRRFPQTSRPGRFRLATRRSRRAAFLLPSSARQCQSASYTNGQCALQCPAAAGRVCETSDTGAGLPPQQADQIFNAFFTTKPHGTGMGLRISRSIVESHGGRLWAVDNLPRGASFYFTLPTKVEANE
ncbi:MAG: ATP-binding protein [Terriglobales bacterium]